MIIKPKRKFTAGAPTTSDIAEGEIAINTADKKLYVRDNANNIVEIGGGGGSASGATTDVTQSSHGFAVKDCIRHTGSAWIKARANSNSTLALGVVTAVADSNTFTVAQSGRFELTSHGLTVGHWYYLSESSAGALTSTEPAISQPLVYVESANFLFVFPYRPTNLLVAGQVPLGIFVDEFTGNGSTAAYTLGADPLSEDNTQVYINGVYQEKSTYAVSGTTLTFDTNITNGSSIEVVRYAASAVSVGIPDNNTVTTAKLAANSVTTAKIADDAVTQAKIADEAVDEARMQISNAGSNGEFLSKQSGNTGGLTWAAVSTTPADGSISTAKLADDAVTAAKIADDAVVQAAIADDAVDEARIQISNAGSNGQFLSKQSGNTGGLTWATVSTTPSPGEIIETLMGQCDGRQVAVGSGTYTLTDVTVQQILSTSYADITGSSISYTPPSGTKHLLYRFGFKYDSTELVGLGHFEIQVDGNAVEPSRKSFAGGNAWEASAGEMYAVMEYVFNLNVGSTDTSEGEFNGWTGAKTIKVRGRDYSATQGGRCHMNTYWDGSGASGVSAAPIKPMLYIQAIA